MTPYSLKQGVCGHRLRAYALVLRQLSDLDQWVLAYWGVELPQTGKPIDVLVCSDSCYRSWKAGDFVLTRGIQRALGLEMLDAALPD